MKNIKCISLLRTKSAIDEKNYKDLVVYFTNYVNSKSIKILSLDYRKSMRKIEENEEKYI